MAAAKRPRADDARDTGPPRGSAAGGGAEDPDDAPGLNDALDEDTILNLIQVLRNVRSKPDPKYRKLRLDNVAVRERLLPPGTDKERAVMEVLSRAGFELKDGALVLADDFDTSLVDAQLQLLEYVTSVQCDVCHKTRRLSPADSRRLVADAPWSCHMMDRADASCLLPDDELVEICGPNHALMLQLVGITTRLDLANKNLEDFDHGYLDEDIAEWIDIARELEFNESIADALYSVPPETIESILESVTFPELVEMQESELAQLVGVFLQESPPLVVAKEWRSRLGMMMKTHAWL